MRLFSSEMIQSYDTYSFGYCNYALREADDALTDIYSSGFLPYSGANGIKDVFYMARSLRINLKDWQPNSENRRILSRFTDLSRTSHPIASFDVMNEGFLTFCLAYFANRHGLAIMPRERLIHLVTCGLITEIIEYRKDTKIIGYVFEVAENHITHYIYSFYDLAFINQSLGLWMMIDSSIKAQEQGKDFMYLGTAYGKKGLYKTNFSNLEFWNGHTWVADREQLRTRCTSDDDRTLSKMDEWKSSFSDSLFTPANN